MLSRGSGRADLTPGRRGRSRASTSTCTAPWWWRATTTAKASSSRVREIVGPRSRRGEPRPARNVTRAMFERADGWWRTGRIRTSTWRRPAARRAASRPMVRSGERPERALHQLDYLTGIPSQCTFIEPAGLYEDLAALEEKTGRSALVHARLPDGRFPRLRHGGVRLWRRASRPAAARRGRGRGERISPWSCTKRPSGAARKPRRARRRWFSLTRRTIPARAATATQESRER